MQKVISIHLRGNAYQLEERGYALLEEYLVSARDSLKQDPDKDEVMQDFEQAMADKCDQLLSEHKTVVTTDEVKKIIEAMGPVEAEASEPAADSANPQADDTAQEPIKKLYTLKDGALIGGVCTGLGAYFNVDVIIVRLAFIVLSLFTFGFSLLLYLALMLIVPEAKTPEQKAELRGQKFNAQAVIDRAKQKYAEVSQYPTWKGQAPTPALTNVGDGIMKVLRIAAGITSVIAGMLAVAVTIAAFAFVWSLSFESVVLHETLRSIPLWHVNGAIAAAYILVFVPLMATAYGLYRLSRNVPVPKSTNRLGIVAGIMWSIALTALICVSIAHVNQLRDYDKALEQNQVVEPADETDRVQYENGHVRIR
jgi:phage shock protein PspC (stress-responsive transcriptional regulator)